MARYSAAVFMETPPSPMLSYFAEHCVEAMTAERIHLPKFFINASGVANALQATARKETSDRRLAHRCTCPAKKRSGSESSQQESRRGRPAHKNCRARPIEVSCHPICRQAEAIAAANRSTAGKSLLSRVQFVVGYTTTRLDRTVAYAPSLPSEHQKYGGPRLQRPQVQRVHSVNLAITRAISF